MDRIGRAVQIEQNPGRYAIALAFTQIESDQRDGQPVTGLPIDGVLQPGEGRLAGQRRTGQRQPPTDLLEERVVTQRGGIVLVLVATGDLVEPLPDDGIEGMLAATRPPVADLGSEGGR